MSQPSAIPRMSPARKESPAPVVSTTGIQYSAGTKSERWKSVTKQPRLPSLIPNAFMPNPLMQSAISSGVFLPVIRRASSMLGKKTSKTYPWTGSQAITDKKTVSVNIPVTETGKVVGVRFSIDGNDSCSEPGITHSYVSDLTAYLANPQAAKITLFDSIGGSGDNICKMNLDDTATKAVSSLSKSDAPFTGTFLPEQAFSGLTGNPANGNWVFSVYDSFDGDSGTINALTLTLDLVENIEKNRRTNYINSISLMPYTPPKNRGEDQITVDPNATNISLNINFFYWPNGN